MDNKNNFYLQYFTLAEKYLHTSGKIFKQIREGGNSHVLVFDNDDCGRDYEEQTMWSDFHVLIPALFLFYHGLELMIKGLIKHNSTEHNIELLFKEIKINYSDRADLINIFEKYIIFEKYSEIWKKYIEANELKDTKGLYFSLRYPTDNSFKNPYNYLPIKYQEEKILPFIQELENDSDLLCREVVKILKN
jgi:hypothetical protein